MGGRSSQCRVPNNEVNMSTATKRKPIQMAKLTAAFDHATVAVNRLFTIEEVVLFAFSDSWAVFIDGHGCDPTAITRKKVKLPAAKTDNKDKSWRLVSKHFKDYNEAQAALDEVLARLSDLGVVEVVPAVLPPCSDVRDDPSDTASQP